MSNSLIITLRNSAFRVALITVGMLLIPWIAMQFTTEVNWGADDFLVAGGLLFGAGMIISLTAGKLANSAYRAAVILAVITALLLIWVNLAVGLIGNENNPANLMYLTVLVIGVIGAFITRLQPRGMSLVMLVMAAAQALVPVIAHWMSRASTAQQITWIATAVFVALWIAAGWLFWYAADDRYEQTIP